MKIAYWTWLIASLLSLSPVVSAQTTSSNPSPASPSVADRSTHLHNVIIAPSSSLRFLTSEAGKKIAAGFPPLAGYLAGMGINVPAADGPPENSQAQSSPADFHQTRTLGVSDPCDAPAGALFNLEPATGSPEIHLPVPQLANSADYVPGGGLLGADLVVAAGDDYRGGDQRAREVGAEVGQLRRVAFPDDRFVRGFHVRPRVRASSQGLVQLFHPDPDHFAAHRR